jgi:DNA-binding phage protein
MPKCQDNVATELQDLRTEIKDHSSIAEVAREVGMQREWLSRVLSPRTQRKIEQIRVLLDADAI